jgi:hypothetical protein
MPIPRRRTRVRHLVLILSAVLLSSCARTTVPQLEREDLFQLEYGKMEDQVELVLDNGAVRRKTRIEMRGGLIYIASGEGARIMEFTSYGDLVTLYYNPATNPRPVMLQSQSTGDGQANRLAYEYPFNVVGELAIMSDNTILVEDQVPNRIAVFDEDLGVELNRVVVRLDRNGVQRDYLGQEGIGGSFFPYIQSIDVTLRDDIVVTTAASTQNIIYWFNAQGDLLRKIELSPDLLPVPAEFEASPILEKVTPDMQLRRLYLKVNYYLDDVSSDDITDRMLSRIYWINIDDGTYEGYVDVPWNIPRGTVLEALGESEAFTYELIGAAPGEHLFLLSQESDTTSQLMILQTSGKVVRRRAIELDYNEIIIRDLSISAEGILTALLAGRDEADVVWWRTDRLFEVGQ